MLSNGGVSFLRKFTYFLRKVSYTLECSACSVLELRMNAIATTQFSKLSLRVNETNENHHLWNNRGVWWCHLTIHQADATAKRLRFSLKTREIEKARERRDRIFSKLENLQIAV